MEEYQDLPGEEQQKKQTKQEKKLAKYKDDMDAITLDKDAYANGINQNRSCTDFFCLIVFLVFLGAMGAVTMYSVSQGNVDKMVAPIDMNKNFCGVAGGAREGYQKLYFTDLSVTSAKDILNSGICLKACPTQGKAIDTSEANVHPDDKEFIEKQNTAYADVGTPPNAYKSKSVMDYCIPDIKALEAQRPTQVQNWKTAVASMTKDSAL